MTTHRAFREKSDPTPPARVEVLEPGDFADSWGARPKKPIAVGLRRLSEAEEQSAIGEATREAAAAVAGLPDGNDRVDEFVERFNERLVCLGVGRAICDPNDVSKEPRDIPMAEDTIGQALRRKTIERLWVALEVVALETSACYREATDDELEQLAWSIIEGSLLKLTGAEGKRARRFAAVMLDDLGLE